MGFQIMAGEHELELNISGWTAVLTLKREIKIPYTSIEEIRIGSFNFPWATAIRRSGITTLSYKAGIFNIDDEKYFLAYRKANEVVMLCLKGFEFDRVVFESKDREQLVNDIQRRYPSILITRQGRD